MARKAVAPGADYGPGLTMDARGRLRSWGGAAEVVVEDRPDPDKPDRGRTPITVRGARRHDAVLAVFGKSAELEAAERFRDDCAAASGIRQGVAIVRSGFDQWHYGPPDQQLDAQSRARAAWQAMGMEHAGLVSFVVLGCVSLARFADVHEIGRRVARIRLSEALSRLVAHYAGEDQGARKSG